MKTMSLGQNLVMGDKNQSFFENFLMCGKLSTWILKVSGILAKKFGQNLFRKIQKVTSLLWGENLSCWAYLACWKEVTSDTIRENYLHIRCEGHIASCDFLELSHWCVLHWNKGLDWNIECYKQLNMMKKHLCKLRVQASFAFNFLFVSVGCLRMDKRCKCDYK